MEMSLIKYSKRTKQVLFSNDLPSRGSGCVPNKSCCLTPQAHQVGVARQTPLISENVKKKSENKISIIATKLLVNDAKCHRGKRGK